MSNPKKRETEDRICKRNSKKKSRKNSTCNRKARKFRYGNKKKIGNREYLEILKKLEIAREKLDLINNKEVRWEELKRLELEILKNLEKPKQLKQLKLKNLRELNEPELELNKVERLKIKRIVKDFHELQKIKILI